MSSEIDRLMDEGEGEPSADQHGSVGVEDSGAGELLPTAAVGNDAKIDDEIASANNSDASNNAAAVTGDVVEQQNKDDNNGDSNDAVNVATAATTSIEPPLLPPTTPTSTPRKSKLRLPPGISDSNSEPLTPASPPPLSPRSPDSKNKKIEAPEIPRWRFVSEAKKTRGYSSVAAGTAVKGKFDIYNVQPQYYSTHIMLYMFPHLMHMLYLQI